MAKTVLCFETRGRGVVRPPYAVQTGRSYYLLIRVSPNAPNCGIYKKVSQREYISRGRR